MNRITVLMIFICLTAVKARSQDMKNLQETFVQAEYFFINEDYTDALQGYLQLLERLPDNAYIAYRAGVCYLNIPGMKDPAAGYLETATRKMSSRIREGRITQTAAPYDALFQLGIAYRINHGFDKAKEAFEKYRTTLLKEDRKNISFIDHEIKVCENAKNFIGKPVDLILTNIGEIFNDESDEFNPVISADGRSFMYMKSMPFYNAVMYSRLVDGNWIRPVNITMDLMTDGDIFISSLSSDGKILFLSQDDDFNSDILYSTFDGTRWSGAVKLNKNINTKYWESHAYVTEDGNTLIFASDRPGGSGGLDLYISRKENGDWGVPVNTGPEINTPFNEDRPSLVNDGKILFFASQNHDNMGGYDILRSEMKENGKWGKPLNPGYPFNTTDDDIFFSPVDKVSSGFVSLFRKSDCFGKRDIYRITFK